MQIFDKIVADFDLYDLKIIRRVSIKLNQLTTMSFIKKTQIKIHVKDDIKKLNCTFNVETINFWNTNFHDFNSNSLQTDFGNTYIKTLIFRRCIIDESTLLSIVRSMNVLKCLRIENMDNALQQLSSVVTEFQCISKHENRIIKSFELHFDEKKHPIITWLYLNFFEDKYDITYRSYNCTQQKIKQQLLYHDDFLNFFKLMKKSLRSLKISFLVFNVDAYNWFHLLQFELEELEMLVNRDSYDLTTFISTLIGMSVSTDRWSIVMSLKKLWVKIFYFLDDYPTTVCWDFSEMKALEVYFNHIFLKLYLMLCLLCNFYFQGS